MKHRYFLIFTRFPSVSFFDLVRSEQSLQFLDAQFLELLFADLQVHVSIKTIQRKRNIGLLLN